MGTLALIDVLERDGSARQSLRVESWPLRVGRAIDNHLVLDDPHIAAHHLSFDTNEDGVYLTVGDSVNGVRIARQHLHAGERWQAGDAPLELTVGRTTLRLRLATHPLAPEQKLRASRDLAHGPGSLLLLLALTALMLGTETYLGSSSVNYWHDLGAAALSHIAVLLAWSGAWTILSKIFVRHGHFGWHLRVALLGAVALQLSESLIDSAAFALSWPALSSFGFIASFLLLGAVIYLHLQAVEPHRHRLTHALTVLCVASGIGLTLWMNWQRSEQLGSELYMSHLRPPVLRLAEPASIDAFMHEVQAQQAPLDAHNVDQENTP